MKSQAFNPYLPSWEYIPDGEPHVFDGRVYIFGSHDRYNGWVFCIDDYVAWSAPVDDLSDWRCEGTIYKKTDDPVNTAGTMVLYAPDVVRGKDGRYYLFYALDKVPFISVAVCDTPAGEYAFYGYVHHADGTRLGEKAGDEVQFDPAVLIENEHVYLYTGFCGPGDKSRHGAMVTQLADDMLTVKSETTFIVPGCEYAKGSSFEAHPFFEAPSLRKIGDTFYFIYSSTVMHELCYATSKSPDKDFTYGGVLVSNCDLHIDSYKSADMPTAYGANNHGSIECVNGEYYIFYHRHTRGTWYSRQGCAEKLTVAADGSIAQVEITSCGLNGAPLVGRGEYSAHIVCNLFTETPSPYVAGDKFPSVMQDEAKSAAYIANIKDGTTAGFKYFDFSGVTSLTVTTRGYASGVFEVRTAINGAVLGSVPVGFTNVWQKSTAAVQIPDGVGALYLTFKGSGSGSLLSFELA